MLTPIASNVAQVYNFVHEIMPFCSFCLKIGLPCSKLAWLAQIKGLSRIYFRLYLIILYMVFMGRPNDVGPLCVNREYDLILYLWYHRCFGNI